MKLFIYKLFFFFLVLGITEATANTKFIDINYVVNNSKIGKSLNAIIDSKNKNITSELNKLKKKLEDKKEKIVSQKNILKEDEFKKLVNNYEVEVKQFNEIRKNKTKDFNTFRINSKKKILDVLNPLIKDFLENKSITILLQKDNILFGNKELDITNEILKILDEKHKTMKF
jgi:outer membrane protein